MAGISAPFVLFVAPFVVKMSVIFTQEIIETQS